MPFPFTPRYFLNYRNSDTGLTPTFLFFQRADTFVLVSPPSIIELSNGRYYFDWLWSTPTDPDIVFQVDGGPSIPTEEVRYISGGISPRDVYVDEPTSQVKDDVWDDTVDRADSTKGDAVEKILEVETGITDIKGAGFATDTDSLKIISDNVDAINIETDAASIASAVWDQTLSSHTTDGTFGQTLQMSDTGLLQAGAASTATLKLAASAIADFYKNGLLVITSGTGVSQSRSITAYDGTTKIATVDRPWGTMPTVGSGYMVVPAAPSSSLTNAGIADAVWDEVLAGHLTAGSTGEKLDSGSGGGGGGGVSFLANGDSANPFIMQVSSPKHTQVKITFSEPVEMTGAANGALNLDNYSIPGLTLIAVSSLTAQQVLLTTSAQTPDFLYSLSVTNVEDTSGNPIL